jgi:ankyrin repeat protein
VSSGARINDATPLGTTALVVAAFSGQSSTAEALLDLGADPNAAGAGYTALHVAVLRGDVALAKKLLSKGANPNAPLDKGTSIRRSSNDWALHPSWVGATPLWLAAKFTDAPLMRALAEAGADTAFVRKDGTNVLLATMADGPDRRSPLFVPIERREVERRTLEAVQAAADLGANVSASTTAGDTALHAAAARGLNSVIEWLAAKGVALDATNKKGLTPLAVASAASQRAAQAAERGQGIPGATPMSTVDLLKKLGASQ